MADSKAIDYHVRLKTLGDLEDFSKYIKDAVVDRISHVERFTGIRLAGTRLHYNDWMHKGFYGMAHHATDRIEIGNTDSALQIAGTVVHELAHIMVGHEAGHGPHWSEACKALGLLSEKPHYEVTDFTDAALAIIAEAIERFAKDHPTLVYKDTEIPVPPGVGFADASGHCTLTGDLYELCNAHDRHVLDFQREDVLWMLRNEKNILLANEMGTGKTVEAVLYINVAKPKRILIVCPNNAKLIWQRHLAPGPRTWCTNDYEVEVAHTALYLFSDVVIMNYEAMLRHGDAVARQKWDLAILDEGHYCKNASSKRAKACFKVDALKKIVITGTPIVNYPFEVFPIAHWLDRATFPEVGRFERMYGARGNSKFGYNLGHLNSLLRSTIMVRRFKKDVMAQLPKKRRQVVEFEVPDEVKPLIDEELQLFDQLQKGATAAELQMLAALKNESDTVDDDIDWQKLIEGLQSTKHYAFERMAAIAHAIGLAKLPLVYEHIEQALEAREKVVVFGHHRDVLTAIANHFKPNSVLVLGGHADQGRVTQEAVDRFNADDECRLFVAGVTLASAYSLQGSSTVIFVEEGWVPGIYTQAEDRAHGIGRGDASAKSMLIQHLVYEDSLDTKKAQMAIKKQKSIDRATGALKA